MTVLIIIPSIRKLKHWSSFEHNADMYGFKDFEVLVIDEDSKNRKENSEILSNVNHSFYGHKERKKWFKDRGLRAYYDVIPKKVHAETSFGLLYAWENQEKYDTVIFMDDDISATNDNFFMDHITNLRPAYKTVSSSMNKWINLLHEYFYIPDIYPRGFPYSLRNQDYCMGYNKKNVNVVMNQGLWINQPDLNAIDILPNQNGLSTRTIRGESTAFNSNNIVVDEGNYTTICSMNLSFKPEIIPAFYQLPMGKYNVDRFDDIWSGLIFKKIADHLGVYISHGTPLCKHDKEPRYTFKDVNSESNGLIINEQLWSEIDKIQLNGRTYRDCYHEIATSFMNGDNKYLISISKYMLDWIYLIDEIEILR